MLFRVFIRHPKRNLPWTKAGGDNVDFATVPSVGDLIETGSAKGNPGVQRVEHVVHRPNCKDGPTICLYVTVEDAPDFVRETLDL
jgi:hypothetical protein